MPTTMLLESFKVSGASVRNSLIGKLRSFARVDQDELSDYDLSAYLWSGIKILLPSSASWSDFDFRYEHGLLLWASVAVLDVRIMESAKGFPITSRVGSTDPSANLASLVQTKINMKAQFDAWAADMGLGETNIIEGEFTRYDKNKDIIIPSDVQGAPPVPTLQLVQTISGGFDVSWSCPTFFDFQKWILYASQTAGLRDPKRDAETSNTGVRDDITDLVAVTYQYVKSVRIEDLAAGNWFVILVAVDLNGRVSASSEISVVVP